MRYFGVETFEGRERVVCEAVGELWPDGSFEDGTDRITCADVRSEPELAATPEGLRALREWRSGDDSGYERDARLSAEREALEDEARLAVIGRDPAVTAATPSGV